MYIYTYIDILYIEMDSYVNTRIQIYTRVHYMHIEVYTYPRGPSISIILPLGPKVCKYYLLWAIWRFRDTYVYVVVRCAFSPQCIPDPTRGGRGRFS